MLLVRRGLQCSSLFLICLVIIINAKDDDIENKPAWKKKKINDYTDADMERLLDQWNVSINMSSEFMSSNLIKFNTLIGRRRK